MTFGAAPSAARERSEHRLVAAHLHAAVERHRRWCRDQGMQVPPGLVALVDLVTGCQEPSESLAELGPGDDAGVALAVDYAEAGRLLGGVSTSSVYRLVKAGRLQAVSVGAAKRIPRSELERFVDDQLRGGAGVNAPVPGEGGEGASCPDDPPAPAPQRAIA